MTEPPDEPDDTIVARPATLVRRVVWIPIGLVCVGLGVVGLIVPGLPGTVFFVAAAAAFSRSSPRLERWVLGLRGVGPLVTDYRAGLGMPARAKVIAISMMSAAVTLSVFTFDRGWARVAVVAAGLIGTVVILRTPTKRTPS